jgi:hypothetical protein
MCDHYNLMTRLCACGEKTLDVIPEWEINTIIRDTNGWVVGDVVSVHGYTYKVRKVMTTGLNWTYDLWACGPRQNPSFISSMVIFEDGLKREGNEPTRTFFWPQAIIWPPSTGVPNHG